MPSPTSVADGPISVLYDRDCGFCRWSVAKLLELDRDGNLQPVAIQSEHGSHLLASVREGERLSSAHAVTPDGRVFSGGDAAPVIAAELRRGKPAAALSGAVPPLTRACYRLVAGNRELVGRFVSGRRRARADTLLAARTLPGSG